jgi:DNA processing protein
MSAVLRDGEHEGEDRAGFMGALGLAWLSESGCHSLLRLLGREGPEAIWRASRRQLVAWGIAPRAALRFEERRRSFVTAEALATLARTGLGFLPFGSRRYPPELVHLTFPPAGLFFRAAEEALERLAVSPRITIVGTRKATADGLRTARAFSSAFAAWNIAVVSGMALGIDAEAHRAALQSGGLTIAVLGCGADIPYPRCYRGLYEQIGAGGIVLSELPPGTCPSRWTFPNRNRLLAALGDAVLVVEASQTSGALQTADRALELGRPVFGVPGSIYAEGYRGCNMLLHQGATPALDPFATVEEFLLQTRIERGRRQPSTRSGLAADGHRTRGDLGRVRDPKKEGILRTLASAPCSVDALVARTSLTVREVTGALAELELEGLVTRAGPGAYIRAP